WASAFPSRALKKMTTPASLSRHSEAGPAPGFRAPAGVSGARAEVAEPAAAFRFAAFAPVRAGSARAGPAVSRPVRAAPAVSAPARVAPAVSRPAAFAPVHAAPARA